LIAYYYQKVISAVLEAKWEGTKKLSVLNAPPLPSHASLLATYDPQEAPPPPGVPRRKCRHDHPHEVVTNSLLHPQSEVIIDLVSDNEE
jgi:hypothetical protein